MFSKYYTIVVMAIVFFFIETLHDVVQKVLLRKIRTNRKLHIQRKYMEDPAVYPSKHIAFIQ